MKKRNLLIIAIIIMSIGFATVSTTLIINGIAKINENIDDFDVYFSKAILDQVDRSGELIDDSNKVITFTSKDLSKVGDTSTLEYEVTNASKNYDAEVSITCEGETEYLGIKSTPAKMAVEATQTKVGQVTVELKKSSITTQELPITCKLNIVASERTSLGANDVAKYNYKAKNLSYDNTKTGLSCQSVQDCLTEIDNILEG